MIVEIVVGLLVVVALVYVVRRHRERAKWAKIREEQLGKLKWFKKKIER